MRIENLKSVAEVSELKGIISEYLDFVCGDLDRQFGVRVPAEDVLASTMDHVEDLVPPKGRAFVARSETGATLGLVFLRPCGDGAVEIKRLYVRPEARGTGAGRALVGHALAAARKMGMRRVYLDSTRNLSAALALYEGFGFRYIDAYAASDHSDDADLAPYMVYMCLDLE